MERLALLVLGFLRVVLFTAASAVDMDWPAPVDPLLNQNIQQLCIYRIVAAPALTCKLVAGEKLRWDTHRAPSGLCVGILIAP